MRCRLREGAVALSLAVVLHGGCHFPRQLYELLLAKGLVGLNGSMDSVDNLGVESAVGVEIHIVLLAELVDEKPGDLFALALTSRLPRLRGHGPCEQVVAMHLQVVDQQNLPKQLFLLN